MRTLIYHQPEPQFLTKFPSFSLINRKPIFVSHYKYLLNPQNAIFSSIKASCTTNSAASYNGWDDYTIWADSDELGESNYFKKFMISSGINDKKYVFTCILGFVCALAISRVRVSSIIVFPAAAIVFAIGFSFGFSSRKPHKNLSLNGSKIRIYAEKLKNLVEIFDGFDVKISDLKNEIKNAIEYERIDFGDLESYLNAVETIDSLIVNARNVVEDCVGGILMEGQEVGKNPKQKNGRRKKEICDKGFNLFGFMGNFFKDNPGDLKSRRTNFVKRDNLAKDVAGRGEENSRGAERASDPVVPTVDGSIPYRATVINDRKNRLDGRDHETKRNSRRGKTNTMDSYMDTKDVFNANEYDYQNVRFSRNQRFSLNMSAHREIRNWVSEDSMSSKSSNTEFDFINGYSESEGSLKNQQIFENYNGAYDSYEGRENTNFGRFRERMHEERMNVDDELYSRKYLSQSQNDSSSFSSSSVSDDMMFDKCLRKAKDLLKEAKECLRARDDEILAEEMLQESAKLLSQAIALKPMSLLAIGQLGNTYLLHGELKLKISREIRARLSKSNVFGVQSSNSFILEDNKDEIEESLINACEECESLLVEAGKKYRMALSIDGNDVRALYNWGLALSFRAQLIADVGPEAALDADKLFLAAIDKFNAMMSRSNDYAPEALFRWGMALQQRSRLRSDNIRDKVKLLQQAKRLYEDAVDMGSNNLQVRKALSSCISEINYTGM